MTLLTTEIHCTAQGEIVVFAADRRITRDKVADGTRPKIFRVPHCMVGIGYFGLAEVGPAETPIPMSVWLEDLFFRIPPSTDPRTVAELLCERLNVDIPLEWRRSDPSGFHVAGLDSDGCAEFWFVRNLDDSGALAHSEYKCREDFKSRDKTALPDNAVQIYRNGDIRAHIAAWEQIDDSFGSLLGQESFRALVTTDDYLDWVKFKMELVARFYDRFAVESIIGDPIDAFAIGRGR